MDVKHAVQKQACRQWIHVGPYTIHVVPGTDTTLFATTPGVMLDESGEEVHIGFRDNYPGRIERDDTSFVFVCGAHECTLEEKNIVRITSKGDEGIIWHNSSRR